MRCIISAKTIQAAFPYVSPGSAKYAAIQSKIRVYELYETKGLPGSNDKEHGWESQRNLVTTHQIGDWNLLRVVDYYLRKKGSPVNVFEGGCGVACTPRTLKTIWGSDVHVDGITLTSEAAEYAAGKFDVPDVYDMLSNVFGRLPTNGVFSVNGREIKKVRDIERVEPVSVRVGLIEGTDIQGQDIIVSFEAMRYVLDQARALEKIVNGLVEGEMAVLEVPMRFLSEQKQRIKELLEKSGISFRMGPIAEKMVGLNGKAIRWFLELTRKSGAKVDLSPFYEIRTEEEYQNPAYRGQ